VRRVDVDVEVMVGFGRNINCINRKKAIQSQSRNVQYRSSPVRKEILVFNKPKLSRVVLFAFARVPR